jgi:Iron-containing redox enzyme
MREPSLLQHCRDAHVYDPHFATYRAAQRHHPEQICASEFRLVTAETQCTPADAAPKRRRSVLDERRRGHRDRTIRRSARLEQHELAPLIALLFGDSRFGASLRSFSHPALGNTPFGAIHDRNVAQARTIARTYPRMTEPLDLSRGLARRILTLMDDKHHWAYPALTQPGLSKDALYAHFRHEYLVYVRDFPVLLARALGVTPNLPDVRCALAENIYEEQTGAISKSAPHPELFLLMMQGLGFSRKAFDEDEAWLCTEAIAYRDFLREVAARTPWQCAVALLTIWVEGSKNERAELAGLFTRKRGDEAAKSHPLVLHYGCPEASMRLVRAHGDIEGSHRRDAWSMLLTHVADSGPMCESVVATLTEAKHLWLAYRDGVATRMGLALTPK